MLNKDRLMVSLLSRVREDYEKLYPYDSVNYEKITDVLHSVCWKIKEKEEQ